MQYLKVTNLGTIPREFLELLGATDKDINNQSTIGFKGSGAKLASIPALRLGLSLIVMSSDNTGPYKLEYATKKSDHGFDQIILNYNDGEYIKETSLTTNGFQDWTKPIGDDCLVTFKLLREVIVNAYDADKDFRLERVHNIKSAKTGYTSVYISWHKDFQEILRKPECHFKFMSKDKPLIDVTDDFGNRVSFYSQSSQKTRIFIQGVLVACERYSSAMFDYSLSDKNLLSEERIVKDWQAMLNTIIKAISYLGNQDSFSVMVYTKDLQNIIDQLLERFVEFEGFEGGLFNHGARFYRSINVQGMWLKAWDKKYGTALLTYEHDPIKEYSVKSWGYSIRKVVRSGVYELLQNKGIATVEGTYARLSLQDTVLEKDLSDFQRETLSKACLVFEMLYPKPNAQLPPIRFFRQSFNTTNGEADQKGHSIGLNVNTLNRGLRFTLEVLAHEYRHIYTGGKDDDAIFINEADCVIAKLLLEIYEMRVRLDNLESAFEHLEIEESLLVTV